MKPAQKRALLAIENRIASRVVAGKHADCVCRHNDPCRTHELMALVKMGLIECDWRGDPGDAARIVWLTDKGRNLLRQMADQVSATG